jgi:hypothetical protein
MISDYWALNEQRSGAACRSHTPPTSRWRCRWWRPASSHSTWVLCSTRRTRCAWSLWSLCAADPVLFDGSVIILPLVGIRFRTCPYLIVLTFFKDDTITEILFFKHWYISVVSEVVTCRQCCRSEINFSGSVFDVNLWSGFGSGLLSKRLI